MNSQFHHLVLAEKRAVQARRSISFALVASLIFHALILFFHIGKNVPFGEGAESKRWIDSPIQAKLAKRAHVRESASEATRPSPANTASKETPQSRKQSRKEKLLTSPNGKWSAAERKEMNDFIKSLEQKKPKTGQELAASAKEAARGIGRTRDQGLDDVTTQQAPKGNDIPSFSLQMYFDSFIKKLNSSARFVKRETGPKGSKKALVEIFINADGSLQNYRILRAADQQTEIAYIKSVVDRAVPFAAFPPDIRRGTNTLSLRLCILPANDGVGGGFSRTYGGDDCN